jgi:tetratricopeptide (TPR) repeat protein
MAVISPAASPPVAAAGAPAPATPRLSPLEAVKRLVAAGRLDEAQRALDALLRASPHDPEVLFLLGMVAEARGDLDGAIERFRAILVDQPGAARVRLELARAFFLKHDDGNAERQFQLALATRVPATVEANVDSYLAAIRARRSWSLSLSVSIAPDSNVNSATSASMVDIYGLPFVLSPDARSHSGAGLAVDTAGEWTPRLRDDVRLRAGYGLDAVLYGQDQFDDITARAYLGAQFTAGRWQVSPLVAETWRWYGGRIYYQGPGPRLEMTYLPAARLRLDASIETQWLTYDENAGQSGPLSTLSLAATYGLSPSSLAHGSVWVSRQQARDPAYAFVSTGLALGYLREFPKGFSASIEPSVAHTVYDRPLAAFGAARVDTTAQVTLSLLNRRIHFKGFAPRLSFTVEDNRSSLPIYSYSRRRMELSLTRQF